MINHQQDIDKICLYAKDPYEAKYQFLIKKRESTGLKHLNDSKAFIDYSNNMDDIYNNNKEYNANKKRKILIVFENEFFIRGRKLNLLFVFITKSYFAVPNNIRLNSIMKISNKRFKKSHLIMHQILALES